MSRQIEVIFGGKCAYLAYNRRFQQLTAKYNFDGTLYTKNAFWTTLTPHQVTFRTIFTQNLFNLHPEPYNLSSLSTKKPILGLQITTYYDVTIYSKCISQDADNTLDTFEPVYLNCSKSSTFIKGTLGSNITPNFVFFKGPKMITKKDDSLLSELWHYWN